MGKRKAIIIFDNGGKTVDRYTGIITSTGDIIGFNDNPIHPQGFGQFSGNVTDRMNITFGYGWRKGHDEKGLKRILVSELQNYISEAKANPEWLGREIDFKTLPEKAQQYVQQCTME